METESSKGEVLRLEVEDGDAAAMRAQRLGRRDQLPS